jgi:hypothetical protein
MQPTIMAGITSPQACISMPDFDAKRCVDGLRLQLTRALGNNLYDGALAKREPDKVQ